MSENRSRPRRRESAWLAFRLRSGILPQTMVHPWAQRGLARAVPARCMRGPPSLQHISPRHARKRHRRHRHRVPAGITGPNHRSPGSSGLRAPGRPGRADPGSLQAPQRVPGRRCAPASPPRVRVRFSSAAPPPWVPPLPGRPSRAGRLAGTRAATRDAYINAVDIVSGVMSETSGPVSPALAFRADPPTSKHVVMDFPQRAVPV